MYTPKRHLPTPGQHGHSPQRHTAAGTAAPTTADTENTVPQRANPYKDIYLRVEAQEAVQQAQRGVRAAWQPLCPWPRLGARQSPEKDHGARVVHLRGQSRIRYSLPPHGFSEPGLHLASAIGKPLGFLWIHVQGFINWANKNIDSGFWFLRCADCPRRFVHLPVQRETRHTHTRQEQQTVAWRQAVAAGRPRRAGRAPAWSKTNTSVCISLSIHVYIYPYLSVYIDTCREDDVYMCIRSQHHCARNGQRRQHHTHTRQEQHPKPPNEHPPQTLNNARRGRDDGACNLPRVVKEKHGVSPTMVRKKRNRSHTQTHNKNNTTQHTTRQEQHNK